MSVVIHHNPECGTLRNVPAIIEALGETPVVIDCLDTGWTRPQLLALFAAADLTPRTALRTTKSPAEELELLDPYIDEGLPPGPMAKEDGTPRIDADGNRIGDG